MSSTFTVTARDAKGEHRFACSAESTQAAAAKVASRGYTVLRSEPEPDHAAAANTPGTPTITSKQAAELIITALKDEHAGRAVKDAFAQPIAELIAAVLKDKRTRRAVHTAFARPIAKGVFFGMAAWTLFLAALAAILWVAAAVPKHL